MKIAVTGATGFIGRYIVRELTGQGHELRCWHGAKSDRSGLEDVSAAADPEKGLVSRLGIIGVEIDQRIAAVATGLRDPFGITVVARAMGAVPSGVGQSLTARYPSACATGAIGAAAATMTVQQRIQESPCTHRPLASRG